MRFKNKIVVITGASAGVGRAALEAFVGKGAKVVAISRNEERLTELEELYGVETFIADVADAERMEEIVEEIEATIGEIDIWVNNAMTSVFSPVIEMEPEEYKRVTEVTYLGYVYSTLAVLKPMMERNRGVIIQVGSTLAYRGIALQSAYCAAKHAIQGFHDSLRSELKYQRSKVEVCMVQLPAINTPQFEWVKSRLNRKAKPVPPIYQPELAAKAILYLAKHPRKELIVGFSSWKAIWADRLFSGLADWYAGKVGYEKQETDEYEDVYRENNLYETVDGNYDSHGRYDEEAKKFSLQFWLTTHRWVYGLILFCALWKLLILSIRSKGYSRRTY